MSRQNDNWWNICTILGFVAVIFAIGYFCGQHDIYPAAYSQGNVSGFDLAKQQYSVIKASSFDLGFNEGLKFNSTYTIHNDYFSSDGYVICPKGEPEYVIHNSTVIKTVYATGAHNKSEPTIIYLEYDSLSPNCSVQFDVWGGKPKPDLAEFYRQWRGF